MATQTVNLLDSIEHMPSGGTLILTDVSWDEYEQLVADLEQWNGIRVTYDQGRLEIMSPSTKHEAAKEIIARMTYMISEEMDVAIEALGSTTYKQKWLQRGLEPDCCFYVQNADKIIGVMDIKLENDPPPDIAVEVDVSHASDTKLKIYAGMNVPEVWLYKREGMRIYQLVEDRYVLIDASVAFPLLTSEVLTRFVKQGLTDGQTAALKSFREWLLQHLSKD
ncbi:MAG TPA: Uma2 family endonuclease [Pyrinomonadaceae bacterium]|nr:Uma2 family endonuclease [Pyrinomonadaceae bacterium]